MTYANAPRIDGPSIRCGHESHACTVMARGRGGFDIHHRWPLSMGGPENPSDRLILCPLHHRRAHALLRHLVETSPPSAAVLRHFTTVERDAATYALTHWQAAGSPPIAGWPCPAATA